jgi:hypothetical protein
MVLLADTAVPVTLSAAAVPVALADTIAAPGLAAGMPPVPVSGQPVNRKRRSAMLISFMLYNFD